MSLSEPDLKALMLRSLQGDEQAYRALLTDVQDRLRSYFARRLRGDPAEIEDLMQDTLIAIHDKRATFDRTQSLTGWAYAIARHKLIDHYRRVGRHVFVPVEHEASTLSTPDASASSDARRDIERGLAVLPERTRDLVRSVKLEDEGVAAVAARTGLSESAVKVAVHRAFLKMVARLREGSERPRD